MKRPTNKIIIIWYTDIIIMQKINKLNFDSTYYTFSLLNSLIAIAEMPTLHNNNIVNKVLQ